MKITMRTDELTRALYRVQGVADRKSSNPAVAYALLVADDDGSVRVSATDLDMSLSGEYSAEVHTPGTVVVPAKQLFDILKALQAEHVDLSKAEDHWIDIKAGASAFNLVGISPDEFPTIPSYDDLKLFPLSAKSLGALIDRSLFCVSTDDNRHNLSGVYCECVEPTTLRFVATDGHRLAYAEAELTDTPPLATGVIVPRKGFTELKRVLSDSDEDDPIQIGFSTTHAVFSMGPVQISTRLIEGDFPDYTQVIPDAPSKVAKIARTAFSDALRRVSLLSQSRAHGVRLTFSTGNLELKAEDPELGHAVESLAVDYSGDELSIGFNARYILDVLAHIQDEGIQFALIDDLSPGIITPIEEVGFLGVVMPMRI